VRPLIQHPAGLSRLNGASVAQLPGQSTVQTAGGSDQQLLSLSRGSLARPRWRIPAQPKESGRCSITLIGDSLSSPDMTIVVSPLGKSTPLCPAVAERRDLLDYPVRKTRIFWRFSASRVRRPRNRRIEEIVMSNGFTSARPSGRRRESACCRARCRGRCDRRLHQRFE